jgi:hypothetical protein
VADDMNSKFGKVLDQFTGSRGLATDTQPQGKPVGSGFAGEFEVLKQAVIRPAFEKVGVGLKERGHEINLSEEPGGKISIHIVPAGAKKSIHPYDWFPTFSVFGAPFTGTVGMHGRNARRNSEGGSGQRGEYKLAQLNADIVEKELMKFVGEIANW